MTKPHNVFAADQFFDENCKDIQGGTRPASEVGKDFAAEHLRNFGDQYHILPTLIESYIKRELK